MKLPAYTIPEQDADLWTCGQRLTGEGARSTPTQREVRDIILDALRAAGRDGLPSKAAIARACNLSIARVEPQLWRLHVSMDHDGRYRFPEWRLPWPDD